MENTIATIIVFLLYAITVIYLIDNHKMNKEE
jgi:hypothetical protein